MKYKIIYADPPWKYNARNNGGTLFGKGAPGERVPGWDAWGNEVEGADPWK